MSHSSSNERSKAMTTGGEAGELWRRLLAFELDDPAANLTFSRRLARENGWSHAYALRVINEYKRFVFLAMTAGHEVTPSDEVDQAWHLHLTYTRSYWDELCKQVLRGPLHHGPTKGGQAEGERFEDQYEQTLASYRTAFGQEPPSDIWPPAKTRFGDAAHFVRMNTRRLATRRRPVLLAGVTVLGAGAFFPLAQGGNFEIPTEVLVVGGIILVVFILWIIKKAGGGGSGGSCGGFFGCGGGSGCGGGGCGGGCGGCGG